MYVTTVVRAADFIEVSEHHTFTQCVYTLTGHPVQAKYNVLRRYDDWLTVRWRQYVVSGHHQGTGFELCFQGQRHVYRHLVTIEVSVIGRTHQWVQLNRFTFNQLWLERLNTKTVKCWCTVQHHWVLTDNFREDVPYLWGFALNHFLRSFNGCRQTAVLQLGEDERLEQLQSHLLRQTTLVQTQLRTYGNYRTARVVNTLTKQVLTETTLLTFNHVCKRLQWTLVRTCDRTATTSVIQQGVYRLLQHTFFVTYNDVRRAQLKQALQTVVTVDHTTVQIVQVGGRKAAAVQRYQWTQIWRQNRQNFHDHPLRIVT